jgi:hypothetical protein
MLGWASVLTPDGGSCARGSGRDTYEEPAAHNNQVAWRFDRRSAARYQSAV